VPLLPDGGGGFRPGVHCLKVLEREREKTGQKLWEEGERDGKEKTGGMIFLKNRLSLSRAN